ncbi:hypothetical protein IAD21_01332 [Abditibacteriota bacterium]|nr:hypothetical protein IAD21_01332 [Abditibacteriota bacterium]
MKNSADQSSSSETSAIPWWGGCISAACGGPLGGAIGGYLGFNLLIWTAPANTNWDHAIGIGVFWVLLGMIGFLVGFLAGTLLLYGIVKLLWQRP